MDEAFDFPSELWGYLTCFFNRLSLKHMLMRTFSNMQSSHPDDIYCCWISCHLLMCRRGWRKLKRTALIVSSELQDSKKKGKVRIFHLLLPSPCNFNSSSFWSIWVNYSCAGTRWEFVTGGGGRSVWVCFICSLMEAHNLHSLDHLRHPSTLIPTFPKASRGTDTVQLLLSTHTILK